MYLEGRKKFPFDKKPVPGSSSCSRNNIGTSSLHPCLAGCPTRCQLSYGHLGVTQSWRRPHTGSCVAMRLCSKVKCWLRAVGARTWLPWGRAEQPASSPYAWTWRNHGGNRTQEASLLCLGTLGQVRSCPDGWRQSFVHRETLFWGIFQTSPARGGCKDTLQQCPPSQAKTMSWGKWSQESFRDLFERIRRVSDQKLKPTYLYFVQVISLLWFIHSLMYWNIYRTLMTCQELDVSLHLFRMKHLRFLQMNFITTI